MHFLPAVNGLQAVAGGAEVCFGYHIVGKFHPVFIGVFVCAVAYEHISSAYARLCFKYVNDLCGAVHTLLVLFGQLVCFALGKGVFLVLNVRPVIVFGIKNRPEKVRVVALGKVFAVGVVFNFVCAVAAALFVELYFIQQRFGRAPRVFGVVQNGRALNSLVAVYIPI